MSEPLDFTFVVPTESMDGDDAEDTALLRQHLEEARAFLLSHAWCTEIRRDFFGFGIGGVVAVFLFEVNGAAEVDAFLWVIVGDLPSAYLVTDSAPTPVHALEAYCALMEDWIASVESEGRTRLRPAEQVFPVAAPRTLANAALLQTRISFLRREILPRAIDDQSSK